MHMVQKTHEQNKYTHKRVENDTNREKFTCGLGEFNNREIALKERGEKRKINKFLR